MSLCWAKLSSLLVVLFKKKYPSKGLLSSSSDSISVPMIPLGLKETKELDLLVPLKVSEESLHLRCNEDGWRSADLHFGDVSSLGRGWEL